MVRFQHDNMSLWYGTEDAPGPPATVQEGTNVEITIGVRPPDASNKVQLLYRINNGALESPIVATFLRRDSSGKIQYFLARFPKDITSRLKAGDVVDFTVVCDCVGRKVPSSDYGKRFVSSFRITSAKENLNQNRGSRTTRVMPNLTPDSLFLQTGNLVMIGLGTLQDIPPNILQPRLVDGIHLRWMYKKGFPWYGFYLFRRPHIEGHPICISSVTTNLVPRRMQETQLETSYATISSDVALLLTDDFSPIGSVEFDLDGRRNLRISLHDDQIARRLQVKIGFRKSAKITVTALLRETPVDQSVISGQAGDIISANLEFDTISDIDFTSGPACLIDLCFVPVSQNSRDYWKPIEGFQYPMRLPITQLQYPCTLGIDENLTLARTLARSRIHYGDPDQFTSPPVSLTTQGTAFVNNGSMIVTGMGTNWNPSLIGKTFQVSGDSTAYIIIKVLRLNEIILSRIYTGQSRNNVAYSINEDAFAQLHDYLIQVVGGGPSLAPIIDRYTPLPVYSTGKISVENGNPIVTGSDGTNWTSDLNGLSIRIIIDSIGRVSVNNGNRVVIGDGTNWDNRLVNMILEINSERKTYTISRVNSATQLTLDQDFTGTDVVRRPYIIRENRDYTILNVNTPNSLTLNRNFAGMSRQALQYDIIVGLTPDETVVFSPLMARQYILDLISLGALHPAIAQMVGLYWIDNTAGTEFPQDYLIVANDNGPILNEFAMLNRIVGNGFAGLDAYIVFNKRKMSSMPLAPPSYIVSYVLPSTSLVLPNCSVQDRSSIVGLRWDLGKTSLDVLLPGKPIMYHLWRADLGVNEPVVPPSNDTLVTITRKRPILAADPITDPRDIPERPRDWPDFAFHTIDSRVQDGWYSYKISGIDIFGRHSANSEFARWYQWGPPSSSPPEPVPYYYQEPPRDLQIHPFAISLLDKEPPPPPAGVEAYALDPRDPTVLKDNSYITWENSLMASSWYQSISEEEKSNLIGLRVSWKWTYNQMRQAPDTREFRIYYQPNQLNPKPTGHTTSVSLTSNIDAEIETDIPNTYLADAYKGSWLQIGTDKFLIIGNASDDPLRVHVRLADSIYEVGTVKVINNSSLVEGNGTNWDNNVVGLTFNVQGENSKYLILRKRDIEFGGPGDFKITLDRNYEGPTGNGKAYTISGIQPRSNMPCSIYVPSPPLSNTGRVRTTNGSIYLQGYGTNWDSSLVNCSLKIEQEEATYMVTDVDSPTQLILDNVYDGPTGQDKRYTINPLFVDYSFAANWSERYHVVSYDQHFTDSVASAYDITGRELKGNQAIVVPGSSPVTIALDGNPDLSHVKRDFDQLFLENDANYPAKPYCIFAVDDEAKTVTLYDTPNLGNNSSRWVIGWPLRKYEVFLPDPVSIYHNGVPLTSSPEQPIVYADIGVSAADDKVYTLDNPKWDTGRWGGRYGNEGSVSAPATIFRIRRVEPPTPIPPPDSERVYASPADYHSRSFYTYRWVPVSSLKTHIFRALDESLFNVDWSLRHNDNRNQLNANELEFFPSEIDDPRWNIDKRKDVARELNVLSTFSNTAEGASDVMIYYRGLSNDALRVLAGLPGNERAFTQLTITPLDPDELDPADQSKLLWRDRIGPDTDVSYVPKPSLRAYVDTLDGRSTNKYFYRAAYVDRANNRSQLSISSPPVWLHDVVAPEAPSITSIMVGDQQITFNWISNREHDLVEFRLYRSDIEETSRDLRLMTLVHTETVSISPGAMTPATFSWTDKNVLSGSHYYYKLVAVDEEGNVSEPSNTLQVVAVDTRIPEPPLWLESIWVLLRDLDNGEEQWPSDGVIPTERTSAIRLVWQSDIEGAKFFVTRRMGGDRLWRYIASQGVYEEILPRRYLLYDKGVYPYQKYSYRIRVISPTGVSSKEFHEIEVGQP